MRLILAPTVELVASTVPRVAAIGRFLETSGTTWTAGGKGTDAEWICEFAGRSCYWAFEKGRDSDAWYANILESGHFSVLEHASFTFAIRGVSRSLTHELVRHRHASPSQLSQRYVDQCDPGVDLGVVVPVDLLDDHAEWEAVLDSRAPETEASVLFNLWASRREISLGHYKQRLEFELRRGRSRKRAHAIARSELPESCETAIVLSGNARSFLEAAGKRHSEHAEAEIDRLFGGHILPILAREMPRVFAPAPAPRQGA